MGRRRRLGGAGGVITTPEQPDMSGTATSSLSVNYTVSNSILTSGLVTVKVQADVTSSALVDYTVFA